MKLKRAARLENAKDVTLVGRADRDYWAAALKDEGLTPIAENGDAHVFIIAAEGTFWRQTFCELSLSVLARPIHRPEQRQGAFLIQAYNSNRFFAFCERRFFQTPYDAADLAVTVGDGCRCTVDPSGGGRLHCLTQEWEPIDPVVDEPWGGPVYLPMPSGKRHTDKAFVARIEGPLYTQRFGGRDQFELNPGGNNGALTQLEASGFEPIEWRIRPTAVHEKSKTYPREKVHEISWTDASSRVM